MAEPYWTDATCSLHLGDCLDVLAAMEPASVDAVVTDPPYGLEFMGQDWDRPWAVTASAATGFPGREDDLRLPVHRDGRNANCRACGGRARGARRCACPAPEWDRAPALDMREFQAWCETWAAECLRVLKPGGHLLAFGGTRTWHRLACGIEDAGFEIRDCTADLTGREGPGLLWLYGSGFPKSLDVSKAIDKAAGAEREVTGSNPNHRPVSGVQYEGIYQGANTGHPDLTAPATEDAARWHGWGTALKPAWEPIVVARRPLAGTVAANVTGHGTGALNVDGCRVEGVPPSVPQWQSAGSNNNWAAEGRNGTMSEPNTAGRWPPNVLLGPEAAAELDRQSGVTSEKPRTLNRNGARQMDGWGLAEPSQGTVHGDTGGASRFFPVFRYEAKAPGSERPRGEDGTAHPTVKPVDLMAWLVRLVTPPGGLVLDPFAGSGTTAEACIIEGFRCVLIEKDPAYAALIRKRLRKDIQPAMFGEVS